MFSQVFSALIIYLTRLIVRNRICISRLFRTRIVSYGFVAFGQPFCRTLVERIGTFSSCDFNSCQLKRDGQVQESKVLKSLFQARALTYSEQIAEISHILFV